MNIDKDCLNVFNISFVDYMNQRIVLWIEIEANVSLSSVSWWYVDCYVVISIIIGELDVITSIIVYDFTSCLYDTINIMLFFSWRNNIKSIFAISLKSHSVIRLVFKEWEAQAVTIDC